MAKKIKRRVKVIPMMIAIAIVTLLSILLVFVVSLPTKNIFVVGNQKISDQEIIDMARLDKYPAFFSVTSFQLNTRLKKHPLIKSVKISRKFFHVFEIKITEKDILFLNSNTSKYVLSDGSKINAEKPYDSPILINYVSDVVYEKFVEEFANLNANIRLRISEIKYDPTTYDEARFLFMMSDGNYVYINNPNMDSLKYYDDICATLDGKKGILYLDSGYGAASSFKVFE